MARMKTAVKTVPPKAKPLWPQIGVRPENRRAIERIAAEWRMNVQETLAALVQNWNNSTDEQRINAIRKPVPETASA
jgi:hypothetical protein